MKRGPFRHDSNPISTEDVVGWFASSRTMKPSAEACAEIARRLNREPSAEWLSYQRDQQSASSDQELEYWDFAETTNALKILMDSLPQIQGHWNRLVDCEDAKIARTSLDNLGEAIVKSREFIEYPFGSYDKHYRKKSKDGILSRYCCLIFSPNLLPMRVRSL